MSIHVQFDRDGEQYHIASNTGWSEFGDWVDNLQVDRYPTLVALWDHGQSNEPQRLATELEQAIKVEVPSPEVAGSIQLLISALKAHPQEEIAYITQ